jgi:hypothetical protein
MRLVELAHVWVNVSKDVFVRGPRVLKNKLG